MHWERDNYIIMIESHKKLHGAKTIMTGFADTLHCQTHAHCYSCRNNEKFRADLIQNFGEFECPLGIPIDAPESAMPSRGLGDTVKKVIDKVTLGKLKKGCGGCNKRRRWLNTLVPYKKKQRENET